MVGGHQGPDTLICQGWLEYWEVLVRCGFFVITAIGTSAVKQQRDASASRIALLEYSQRLEREIIGTSERERERIGQDFTTEFASISPP